MTAAAVPGPRGGALARNLVAYGRDPLGLFTELAREYGDIVRFTGKPQEAYLINGAEHVMDVLSTRDWNFVPVRPPSFRRAFHQSTASTDGYHHRRHRQLFEPEVFAGAAIAPWQGVITGCGDRLREGWKDGAVLDIEPEMARLTAAVMGETFFGPDVYRDPREIEAAVTAANFLATRTTHPMGAAFEAVPVLPSNRRFWGAISFLEGQLYRRIEARRAGGEDRADLLGRLMRARDADGEGMADRQIRDELISIYMIPPILMTRALTWTWYLLATNPEAEAKLHAEVDGVLGNRLPTAEDQPRLAYTRMVVAEAMRLYPPSWAVARKALQDFEIGGYAIGAGAVLVPCAFVTHRDRRYYDDPARFDPQRWTPEAMAERPDCSYYPFSGGPRNCLGQHYAWMVMVLLVATLAQKWRLRIAPGQRIEMEALFVLRPKRGMAMRPEQRGG
jgi:cytochrome P450